MFRIRGLSWVFLVLAIVAVGVTTRLATGIAPSKAATVPAKAAAPVSQTAPVRALEAVETAFNAGDVTAFCSAGGLVDPAVVSEQNAQPGGCRGEVESLIGNEPPMQLTVRSVRTLPDLAQVSVANTRDTAVAVDLVRRGTGWVLSFSNGSDPLPALMGTS